MKKVASIVVPPSGDFSFMLPIPEGEQFRFVHVGSRSARIARIGSNLIRVRGHGIAGEISDVMVGNSPSNAPLMPTRSCNLGFPGGDEHYSSGVWNGLRYKWFEEHYAMGSVVALEISNAEWTSGKHQGPVSIPEFSFVMEGVPQAFPRPVIGKILNPREHIVLRFATAEHLRRGEHLIQCHGDWSYQTVPAWGPQQIRIPNPELVHQNSGVAIRDVALGSPLRAAGFAGGGAVGGFLIEPCYRPCLAGEPMRDLLDGMDAMTERNALWAFFDGKPFDPTRARIAYNGPMPYRAELTNIPRGGSGRPMMIPEFLPENWKEGANVGVDHDLKPNDGQHAIRVTTLIKTAIWNTGDAYAIHALNQLSAHYRLCMSHLEHRDVGWAQENSVYGALNRLDSSKIGKGYAVGKREDAWTLEAQVMEAIIGGGLDVRGWLEGYVEVIKRNILPTGVGVQWGNSTVEHRSMSERAVTAPGHTRIQPGDGITQTFEIEHWAHALYCLSNLRGIEGTSVMTQYVVAASKLIGNAMKEQGNTGRWAPFWYLKTANSDGSPEMEIRSSTGYAGAEFENWYGMLIHSYAAKIAGGGGGGIHEVFLRKMYGGDFDLPSCGGNEQGRSQAMRDFFDEPTLVIVDPPVVDPPLADEGKDIVIAQLNADVERLTSELGAADSRIRGLNHNINAMTKDDVSARKEREQLVHEIVTALRRITQV